ncbi:FAD-binding protein [Gordonia sp. LSe1-13]|uniref:FAD-binding protein n=1 Tax=Gordonia sesuvii TaxID=3116777 RepID=A0ABU7M964_9ACTN|nr:FAD-binding protein [Gordonia sp. LSe1-13]
MVDWDETCDTLVVGSGGGGVCGAYTAAREGLEVILIEATDKFGGTTSLSGGGGSWFPCNPVSQRAGSDDTIESALAYYHSVVGDASPRALQDAYVRGGAPLIEYLESDEWLTFVSLPWPDYFGSDPNARLDGLRHIMPAPLPASEVGDLHQVIRGPLDTERLGAPLPDTLIGGRALIGRFLSAMAKYPHASMQLNTELVELVVEDNRVTGAIVERDGVRSAIAVRRGVLLAAGGFERNQVLREKYGVPGAAQDSMGPRGNLGKALQAAVDVGADTDLMDQAWWSPGLTHPDGRSAFALGVTAGIFVNNAGERFVNESAPYDILGRQVIELVNTDTMTLPFWLVYDNRSGENPPVQATNVSFSASDEYRRAGLWHTADSLEELADLIGVPAAALAATVARYNTHVRDGEDADYGRGEEVYDRSFSNDEKPLVPIAEGPFHAAAFGLSDLGTKGGLRTDTAGRVINVAGSAIDGLHATGNTMAAPSGRVYPGGGNPIGTSMLFAHLAAKNMAEGMRE